MRRVPVAGIGMTSRRTRDRLVQRLQGQGVSTPRVLEVIRATPRHLFVDEALASLAYDDTALPIGFGQTLSQPYIVARMTELLIEGGAVQRVLEVGTGSGYQAAVLAQLVEQVYTVERIEALLLRARRRFQELGLRNVLARHRDGGEGWPDYAPYDGILVTAAVPEVPSALLEQLAVGGCLVIPVGEGSTQRLHRIVRGLSGFEETKLETVRFVPLQLGKS